MAVWPNTCKCYCIRLRGTKEGQERASIGHLEISSMSPVERQKEGRVEELKMSKRGTRGTREGEQEHIRVTTGGQKMYNRSTTEDLHRTENT